MNKYHQEILEKIKKVSNKERVTLLSENYLGSSHRSYNTKTSDSREIAKAWSKDNQLISTSDFVDLLDSLYEGESMDEKNMASKLLGYLPRLRLQLDPKLLDVWLPLLNGWAEIDSLCQSNFTAKELLENWNKWEPLLESFSVSDDISKKRASLVLLTGPVRHSNDQRLSELAFMNIEKLESEKNILITKAISWLLRDLTYLHRAEVEVFLKENHDSLPKIAIRETTRKLITGKK